MIGGDTAEARAADDAATLDAARAVFGSRWVRQWAGLELHSFRLTGELARAMTGPGTLSGLEALGVQDGADDEAVRVLVSADWPKLAHLSLVEVMRRFGGDEPLLTDEMMPVLVRSPLLSRLESLTLWGDWLTALGLVLLADAPAAAGLRTLYPWPVGGSELGLRRLLRSPHLAGLIWLNLSRVGLSSETVELLADPATLPNLDRLDVPDGIPRPLVRALRRRFGKRLRVGAEEDRQ